MDFQVKKLSQGHTIKKELELKRLDTMVHILDH